MHGIKCLTILNIFFHRVYQNAWAMKKIVKLLLLNYNTEYMQSTFLILIALLQINCQTSSAVHSEGKFIEKRRFLLNELTTLPLRGFVKEIDFSFLDIHSGSIVA